MHYASICLCALVAVALCRTDKSRVHQPMVHPLPLSGESNVTEARLFSDVTLYRIQGEPVSECAQVRPPPPLAPLLLHVVLSPLSVPARLAMSFSFLPPAKEQRFPCRSPLH